VQPDLVILDLLLPKINGLEAARQITEISPGTKVVFLSESLSREMMREALRIGAGFVMKADAERDLLSVVKAAVYDKPVVLFRFLGDEGKNSEEV
jgi:DNA-binding NarL/FixJ family response regulator